MKLIGGCLTKNAIFRRAVSHFVPGGRIRRWVRVLVSLAGGGPGDGPVCTFVVLLLVERDPAAVLAIPHEASRVQLRVHAIETFAQFVVAQAEGTNVVVTPVLNPFKLLAKSIDALKNKRMSE